MKNGLIALLLVVIGISGISLAQAQDTKESNNTRKMKIMVTGHKGFIGGHFVQAFADRYEIVGYDLKDGDDILDYDRLRERMKGCGIVVHEAAIPAPVPGKSYEDYFRTNVEGTFNVLKAAYENGVKRVVYASSTTVYGIEGGIPFSYPLDEGQKFVSQYLKADEMSCRDIDLSYHTSKVMAEQMVAWYGLNKKIETVALRYGPTEHVNLGAHVSMPNVLQATRLAVDSPREFWYEAFSIVDGDVEYIDISKARELLGYDPEPATYAPDKVVATFEDRLKLSK